MRKSKKSKSRLYIIQSIQTNNYFFDICNIVVTCCCSVFEAIYVCYEKGAR